MAILKVTGFEHGSLSINGGGIVDVLAGTPEISSTIKRSGSYSIRFEVTGTNKYFQWDFHVISEDEEPIGWTTVFDDDQASFWTAGGAGSGSVAAPTLSNDLLMNIKNTDCLKIAVGSGGYLHVFIYHNYTVHEDWSGDDYICFYWYGRNSGKSIRVACETPNLSNYGYSDFTDNWKGYQRVVLPLKKFTVAAGTLDWSDVAQLKIMIQNASEDTWFLDRGGVTPGSWKDFEVMTPSMIKHGVQTASASYRFEKPYVDAYSWNGSSWIQCVTAPGGVDCLHFHEGNFYFLDGSKITDITGDAWDKAKGSRVFYEGLRGTIQVDTWHSASPEQEMTYTTKVGPSMRWGFRLKMPPATMQASGKQVFPLNDLTGMFAINKTRLRLRIYYDLEDTKYVGFEP